MISQEELQSALKSISERLGIKGYIYIYLEGDRVKFLGDMSLSALTPLLLDYLTRRNK